MLRLYPGTDQLGLEVWKLQYLDQLEHQWLEVQTFCEYQAAQEALKFELKHFMPSYQWYAYTRKESALAPARETVMVGRTMRIEKSTWWRQIWNFLRGRK